MPHGFSHEHENVSDDTSTANVHPVPHHHRGRHRPSLIFSGAFALFFLIVSIFGGGIGAVVAIKYIPSLRNFVVSATSSQETGDGPGSVTTSSLSVVEDSATVDVVEQINPSVVSIVVSKELDNLIQRGPFLFRQEGGSGELQDVGGGTGFFVSKDGLILTNKHVVSDADAQYSVILSDGARHAADVVSLDPLTDLAVIQIKPDEGQMFTPLTLGDSDDLRVGQTVLAFGNSLAEYQNSVTKGVISGIGREIVAGGLETQESLDNVIQTDAAINPGNSGGPLVDLSGHVVGINTAVDKQGESIGFALPINEAKEALASFEEFGEIARPMLGVRYTIVTPTVAEQKKLTVDHGALVAGDETTGEVAVVAGSPAEAAGIREGDVLTAIDGVEITEEVKLADLIQKYQVGDEILITYVRDGKEAQTRATLAKFE